MSTRRTIAVLLVVLVAGCLGPMGGGSSTESPVASDASPPHPSENAGTESDQSRTDRDASTTEHGESSGSTAISDPGDESEGANLSVPGVSNGRLVDGVALVEHSLAELNRTGYVARTVRLWGEDGSDLAVDSRSRLRVERGGAPYNRSIWYRGVEGSSTDRYWSNGTTSVEREETVAGNGEKSVQFARNRPPRRANVSEQFQLFQRVTALSTFTVAADASAGSDPPVSFELRSYDESAPELDNVSDIDGSFALDRAGRVRAYNLTIRSSRGDSTRTSRYRFRATEVGNVTVRRPDWVRTALAETGPRSIAVEHEYPSQLAVSHTGSTAYEPGAEVALETPNGTRTAALESPFEPGEQRFVFVHNETGELRLSQNRRFRGVTPLEAGTYTVRLLTADGERATTERVRFE